MRVPLSWLREYVPVEVSARELADRLVISTCEVDRIERRGVADVDGNPALFRVGDVLPLTDEVLEVETGHNRPDLLAVYGIAREVAALYELVLADPPGRDPSRDGDEHVEVEVDDFEGCPRYIGRLFRDVTIAPSPL